MPKPVSAYNDQHKLPSPEDVIPCEDYTLTLNPCDELQCFKSNIIHRLNDFRMHQSTHLLCLVAPYAKYNLYIEISKRGRLHMHGTISITDVLGFYMKAIPALLSQYSLEIDTITDRKVWDIYCMKQAHIWPKKLNSIVTSQKPLPTLTNPLTLYMTQQSTSSE